MIVGTFGRQVAMPSLFYCRYQLVVSYQWVAAWPGLFEILLSLVITFPCFRGICADKENHKQIQ
jgi:hypothetical protein